MPDVFQLPGKLIDGVSLSCLGSQLVRVVHVISRVRADLEWYAADVEVNVGEFPARGRQPVFIGSSANLADVAGKVDQFLYGVFLAVDAEMKSPQFRSAIDTEDSVDADLGDAVIEIRTFDTTYIEIHTCDEAVSEQISRTFGVAPLGNTSVA